MYPFSVHPAVNANVNVIELNREKGPQVRTPDSNANQNVNFMQTIDLPTYHKKCKCVYVPIVITAVKTVFVLYIHWICVSPVCFLSLPSSPLSGVQCSEQMLPCVAHKRMRDAANPGKIWTEQSAAVHELNIRLCMMCNPQCSELLQQMKQHFSPLD